MYIDIVLFVNDAEVRFATIQTLYNLVKKKEGRLANIVANTFVDRIKGSEEWLSLQNRGDPYSLMGQLGMDKNRVSEILGSILDTWRTSFFCDVNHDDKEIDIKFGGVRENYADVLNLPVASFISKGGHTVPWLRWLLIESTTIHLPFRYRLKKGNKPGTSRSGLGYMFRPKAGYDNWSMPVEFRKGPEDVFAVRMLKDGAFRDLLEGRIVNELLR